LATESGMHRCSQLEAARALRTRYPARQDRWESAQPEGSVLGPSEAEARATPLAAAGALATGQVVSEKAPARLPRPILWLAFAGWAACCGMLFLSLVQREPPGARDSAWKAEPLLVATVSAALETVFGDLDRPTRVRRGRNGTAGPPSTRWP
jgi:hypothetical protein